MNTYTGHIFYIHSLKGDQLLLNIHSVNDIHSLFESQSIITKYGHNDARVIVTKPVM